MEQSRLRYYIQLEKESILPTTSLMDAKRTLLGSRDHMDTFGTCTRIFPRVYTKKTQCEYTLSNKYVDGKT